MKNQRGLKKVIGQNYLMLIFVIGAFLLMVLVGGIFVNNILRNRLREEAEAILFSAESNIKAGLSEVESILLNSEYIIRNMIDLGASHEEILAYLTQTTIWMQQREGGLLSFSGLYGYIGGKMVDSIDINPDETYIPQRRPWYQTAVRSGTAIAYTAPYEDWRTGESIISAVKNINGPGGDRYGILAVNVDITWIKEYVESIRLAPGGYGMIVSQNMTLITNPHVEHPQLDLHRAPGQGYEDPEFQLQDLSAGYGEISRMLRRGETPSARRIRDTDGAEVIVFFRGIFNGWHVGLITPYNRFYRDLFYTMAVLSFLGIILAFSLSYILLRLSAAKIRSEEENKSKSSFLARMSHEIRTPMNAIIGISELALREENSPKTDEYISGIRHAGENLLSIINDILDFSKIESGKLDIVPAEYMFASLINDCIGIIRTRLTEKPVALLTKIDARLPARFYGDESRIRQILLNLLSNAVKYTHQGYITLSIGKGSPDLQAAIGDMALINFEIADTGIGIRPEDMDKLFGNFARIDEKKNQGIEGTGLGLTISRQLCRLMGGDITVSSSYGSGSVFTASIPQKVVDKRPFAAVHEPETKKVLIYETVKEYADSLVFSVETLGAPCTLADNKEAFYAALDRIGLRSQAFQYVMIRSSLLPELRSLMEEMTGKGDSPGPVLVVLAEQGESISRRDTKVIIMPAHPLTIARLLNGEIDSSGGVELKKVAIRFTAPKARILLVDDVPTNLVVSEGLLAPYQTKVDCCASGEESVKLASRHYYDIIFMDHMMPGMDGLEAAGAIRSMDCPYAKDMTIIALTANAVSGMREMFLSKGFNDYLSKPIEIAKLDEIMEKWIPREKKVNIEVKTEKNPASDYPLLVNIGVDIQRGLTMTGGSDQSYRKILETFCQDIRNRLPLFTAVPDRDNLKDFILSVHALKGAAGAIGAAAVSKQALDLERAGRAGDLALIQGGLANFYRDINNLAEQIDQTLNPYPAAATEKAGGDGTDERI
ncbi:hypothetical protein AGMMS49546_18190 [Spirochaetia bacterium]|nr:hypothetical protein AGMMS49546_18190 [Spirochaetia bacterium]